MSLRIGINGAGRIGRALLRQSLGRPELSIVAINDLAGPETIAHLLRYDSIHGPFPAPIEVVPGALVIGGRHVAFSSVRDPEQIPWRAAGVDVAVEATGAFSSNGGARGHLAAGARRVLVTSISASADRTIVLGPHDGRVDPDTRVIATASCTTHAAALPLLLLEQWFGIEAAEMTTVHCTTGSQPTIDGPHDDLRRARSAMLSMIPTSTSAAQGLVAALPFLAGRLTCLGIRVPTTTVSLVEIVAHTRRPVDPVPALAARFRAAAAEPPCRGRLGVSDEPLVSIDYKGNPHSSVVDLPLLARPGEHLVRVIAWYDNEHGYAGRVVELLTLWSESPGEEDR